MFKIIILVSFTFRLGGEYLNEKEDAPKFVISHIIISEPYN